MTDRDKVIKGLENCSIQNDFGCQGCPYLESRKQYGHEWCTTELAQDALTLLKEQQEQIDRLTEENASNAEMAEGLRELLKESVSQGVVDQIRWERDTALSQLKEIGKGLGEKMDDIVAMLKEQEAEDEPTFDDWTAGEYPRE